MFFGGAGGLTTKLTPEELAAVEITPMGDALHWERLDADLSALNLLQVAIWFPAMDG